MSAFTNSEIAVKSPSGMTTAAGGGAGIADGAGDGRATASGGTLEAAGGVGAGRPHDDTAATLSAMAPAAQARATREVTLRR
jgi:hypothetical protein